jgi:hypothetical protein
MNKLISKIFFKYKIFKLSYKNGTLLTDPSLNLMIKEIINKYDRALTHFWDDNPPINSQALEIRDLGFCILRQNFSKDDLKGFNYKEDSLEGNNFIFNNQKYLEFLCNANILNLVKNYLGDYCRLDKITLDITGNNEIRVADTFHYDIVGHRIKVYIYLEDTRQPTTIIPKTHKNTHYQYNLKYSRVQVDNSIYMKEVIGDAGDCLIFDTNMLHKGVYKKQFGGRVALVLEYCDARKSTSISAVSPCGPRGLKFPIGIINECDKYLIDQNSIIYKNNQYFIY